MNGNRVWFALLRAAAGAIWLFQAYPKFTGNYLGGGFIQRVSAMAAGNPWKAYANFLHGVVLPHASLFAYLTLIGDVLVGACLLLGLLTPYASLVGIFLNLNYGLAAGWMTGTDYSLNALLIVVEALVMSAGAGKYGGLDAMFGGSAKRSSRRY